MSYASLPQHVHLEHFDLESTYSFSRLLQPLWLVPWPLVSSLVFYLTGSGKDGWIQAPSQINIIYATFLLFSFHFSFSSSLLAQLRCQVVVSLILCQHFSQALFWDDAITGLTARLIKVSLVPSHWTQSSSSFSGCLSQLVKSFLYICLLWFFSSS